MRSSAGSVATPVDREPRVRRTILFDLDDTLIQNGNKILPDMMEFLCKLASDKENCCAIVTHGGLAQEFMGAPHMHGYVALHQFRQKFAEAFTALYPTQEVPELFYVEPRDVARCLFALPGTDERERRVVKPCSLDAFQKTGKAGHPVPLPAGLSSRADLLSRWGKGAEHRDSDRSKREHLMMADILKGRGGPFDVEHLVMVGDQFTDVAFARDIEGDLKAKGQSTTVHKILLQHPRVVADIGPRATSRMAISVEHEFGSSATVCSSVEELHTAFQPILAHEARQFVQPYFTAWRDHVSRDRAPALRMPAPQQPAGIYMPAPQRHVDLSVVFEQFGDGEDVTPSHAR